MPAAVDTMAYVGEVPWHGLGNEVAEGISADEMAIAAGLAWAAKMSPLTYYAQVNKSSRKKHAKFQALYRDDTGDLLDLVGPRYKPFQNSEILGFFQEYVAAGDMHLHTAGSLMDGKYIWALAKMNKAFSVGKGTKDRNEGYVLLMNPHQYGKGMIAKFTNISVVCWNTLQAALRSGSEQIKLWHNREFDDTLQAEAKERLGIARERMDALEENANILAQFPLDDEDVVLTFVTKHFGGNLEEPSRPSQRVLELFAGAGQGSTLPSRKGTAWGLVNAVTEYMDHHYGNAKTTTDTRLSRSWLGLGEVTKRTAFAELLAMAKAA